MGTRNLTCVVQDKEYKIAQYGQWDGYPSGQGVTILKFLRAKGNIESLKLSLSRARFYDDKGKDKKFIENYNLNTDTNRRTNEQIQWFETFISRDIGGEILQNIVKSEDKEILLKNSIDFVNDSLFCEYAYVVDFDNNTFEIYKGFNQTKLDTSERFYSEEETNGYYPVRLLKTYTLNKLPTEKKFLKDLDTTVEDET